MYVEVGVLVSHFTSYFGMNETVIIWVIWLFVTSTGFLWNHRIIRSSRKTEAYIPHISPAACFYNTSIRPEANSSVLGLVSLMDQGQIFRSSLCYWDVSYSAQALCVCLKLFSIYPPHTVCVDIKGCSSIWFKSPWSPVHLKSAAVCFKSIDWGP